MTAETAAHNTELGTIMGIAAAASIGIAIVSLCLIPALPAFGGIFFVLSMLVGLLTLQMWDYEKSRYVAPLPVVDENSIRQQTPHGKAQFASADELRRGGFIE